MCFMFKFYLSMGHEPDSNKCYVMLCCYYCIGRIGVCTTLTDPTQPTRYPEIFLSVLYLFLCATLIGSDLSGVAVTATYSREEFSRQSITLVLRSKLREAKK